MTPTTDYVQQKIRWVLATVCLVYLASFAVFQAMVQDRIWDRVAAGTDTAALLVRCYLLAEGIVAVRVLNDSSLEWPSPPRIGSVYTSAEFELEKEHELLRTTKEVTDRLHFAYLGSDLSLASPWLSGYLTTPSVNMTVFELELNLLDRAVPVPRHKLVSPWVAMRMYIQSSRLMTYDSMLALPANETTEWQLVLNNGLEHVVPAAVEMIHQAYVHNLNKATELFDVQTVLTIVNAAAGVVCIWMLRCACARITCRQAREAVFQARLLTCCCSSTR